MQAVAEEEMAVLDLGMDECSIIYMPLVSGFHHFLNNYIFIVSARISVDVAVARRLRQRNGQFIAQRRIGIRFRRRSKSALQKRSDAKNGFGFRRRQI